MGLFQKAVETYDTLESIAGVRAERKKEPLAPIGHIIKDVAIEITVDEKGNFVSADKLNEKIPIPATEQSAGRSGSHPKGHPLCDMLEYVAGLDEDKHKSYLETLNSWAVSEYGDKKLDAIREYVSRGTIISDLENIGLIERDDKNSVKNCKDTISWRVIGLGEESGSVYDDTNLHQLFYEYYISTENDTTTGYCMITGKKGQLAKQHLKGVSSISGNAKLISDNDSTNFTYKGRFQDSKEAMSVSYEASQKAHNALKWLIANEGIVRGNRTIVCWNPKGIETPKPDIPLDFGKEKKKVSVASYYERLRDVIDGYKKTFKENEDVVIATFEAATSGRLSVTYYNELNGSDFLDRLKYWDETCCWYSYKWGMSSPSLHEIINYAYGTYREEKKGGKFEADKRIIGQQLQRLISCRVDRALLPKDVVRGIVERASNLQLYSSEIRENVLFMACAIVKKYKKDNFKEDVGMALDPTKRDRSYQYGRLLAILEKIERDTYDSDEKRESNAIRSQAFFVQRPQVAFSQIMTQLKSAYYPQLNVAARIYYDKIIGEIIETISSFDSTEVGKPLDEMYLIGYYLQKNELYRKKEESKTEEEE